MSKARFFKVGGMQCNLLSDEDALARTHSTIDFVESAVKSQLKRQGYPQDYHSLLRMTSTTKADDRRRGVLGSSISILTGLLGPDENQGQEVPQQIIDLGGSLGRLTTLRAHLSAGRMAEAIHDMHYATVLAMRGEAELFERDTRTAKASEMGKISGEVRSRRSRRVKPVYREYLDRATAKTGDRSKTGIPKRAHRMLLKDCERFRDAQAGDEIAHERFLSNAPSNLGELLLSGWSPPATWQTLYKHYNTFQKQ